MSSWRRGKAYAQDLWDRVLSVDGVASSQVAARFGVSISYVVKARQRRDRLGAVTAGAQRSHTRPKLAGHEAVIRAQVRLLPDMTLDELRAWILKALGISVSIAYLSRYTHRVAIANRRLIAFDEAGVTVRYKDYRRDGAERQRVMTLAPYEFIRRFLLHVLPPGFHRIRHYGLLASSARKASIARARELLAVAPPPQPVELPEPLDRLPPCPCCGGRMTIIETFSRWSQPRAPPRAPTPTGSGPS